MALRGEQGLRRLHLALGREQCKMASKAHLSVGLVQSLQDLSLGWQAGEVLSKGLRDSRGSVNQLYVTCKTCREPTSMPGAEAARCRLCNIASSNCEWRPGVPIV